MSRLLRIAGREYLAFVRTVGFWLSICLMPLGLFVAIYASGVAARTSPAANLAIVDFSGANYGQALAAAVRAPAGPRPVAVVVDAPG
ncbi:MAG: ABC transporter permease, partial [Caulobacterales bacterium]